jgi:Domain of unknown function (DUF5658)
MVLKFWCARCGRQLFAAGDRAGTAATCHSCRYEQSIPHPTLVEPQDSVEALPVSPEPSIYEMAAPPNLWPVPRPLAERPARPLSIRNPSPAHLLRSLALEASLLQGPSLCLVALSVADLLMTFMLLRTSYVYYEANPVARWFFLRWDMIGMTAFKFVVIGGVITLGEVIERRRPGWGRVVLLVGCAAAAVVVWHGARLYLGMGGFHSGAD